MKMWNVETSKHLGRGRVKGIEHISMDISVLLIYSICDEYSIYLRDGSKNINTAFSSSLTGFVENSHMVYQE